MVTILYCSLHQQMAENEQDVTNTNFLRNFNMLNASFDSSDVRSKASSYILLPR